jgi:catechol-2,3-dioxygenase
MSNHYNGYTAELLGVRNGGKTMISHVSIGVGDLAEAGRFYDAALAALGYKRLYDSAEKPWTP